MRPGGTPAWIWSSHRLPRPGRPPGPAAGLPVTREFWSGPLRPGERAVLRRSLGLSEDEFLVLLAGGGEGSGGIARRAAAILRWFADVDVVAVCGRNTRLKRRLDRLAARSGGRLTVTGFTRSMADLLRCCDLVVTKAGPGTIAEAACCGAPMLLTSHLPGQETGNAELVTAAGAGQRLPGIRQLVTEIGRLRARTAPRSARWPRRPPGWASPAPPPTSPSRSPAWSDTGHRGRDHRDRGKMAEADGTREPGSLARLMVWWAP